MIMREQSTGKLQREVKTQYKRCLNCGTNLQGSYCHNCGQHASSPIPKVWEFILEYMNNAYIWDPKFFLTIWNLIRRPGFLTKEFNAGKFVAYENPLKLNMFFLFVFVTIFLLFSDIQKAGDSLDNIARSELVRPHLTLNALSMDSVYSSRMKDSERDTVHLSILLSSAHEFPEIITTISTITNNGEERMDTIVAVVPRVLIDDKILVRHESDIYSFSDDNIIVDKLLNLDLVSAVLNRMLEILSQYFPMIFLLTSPLLAFAVKLLHWRRRYPSISCFIFALHYTAFIELVILLIYIMYLAINPGLLWLEWFMIISSCLYLTIAVKEVYERNSWIKSIAKAFMISLTYFLICFAVFFVFFIVAIFASVL